MLGFVSRLARTALRIGVSPALARLTGTTYAARPTVIDGEFTVITTTADSDLSIELTVNDTPVETIDNPVRGDIYHFPAVSPGDIVSVEDADVDHTVVYERFRVSRASGIV